MERWAAILADTDAATRKLVARSLSPLRYEIITASTPDEIVRAMAGRQRALVVVALSFPGLEPAEFCRTLNEAPGFAYIVFMLERYDPDLVTEGFEAGADDVLAKPLIAAELRARLQHAARVLALEDVRAHLEDEGTFFAEISARTNFHSRRYLETQLESELARARRFAHSLAVVLANVGNIGADERAMRAIGHFLSQRFRSSVDWVARYDDQRFALVLPETNLAGALCATRRLQAELSDDALLTSTGLPKHLSVQFGVSAVAPAKLSPNSDGSGPWPTVPADPPTLLKAAEAYLLDAARQRGTKIAGGPAPHP